MAAAALASAASTLMLLDLPTQIALQAAILLSADPRVPMRAKDLALYLGVSPPHMQRVLGQMKKCGLVRSVRGPMGGVVLARPPELITVWEVLVALEPVEALEYCLLGLRRCNESNPCALHEAWGPLRARLLDELRNRTLRQAVTEAQRTSFAGFGREPLKLAPTR